MKHAQIRHQGIIARVLVTGVIDGSCADTERVELCVAERALQCNHLCLEFGGNGQGLCTVTRIKVRGRKGRKRVKDGIERSKGNRVAAGTVGKAGNTLGLSGRCSVQLTLFSSAFIQHKPFVIRPPLAIAPARKTCGLVPAMHVNGRAGFVDVCLLIKARGSIGRKVSQRNNDRPLGLSKLDMRVPFRNCSGHMRIELRNERIGRVGCSVVSLLLKRSAMGKKLFALVLAPRKLSRLATSGCAQI